jgi:hypothetical protein
LIGAQIGDIGAGKREIVREYEATFADIQSWFDLVLKNKKDRPSGSQKVIDETIIFQKK